MTSIIPYLVFGCLLAFGSLLVLILLLIVWEGWRSKQWPAAVGKVVRSGIGTEVRETSTQRPTTWVTHGAQVEYEYQVGGEKLTGSTVHVGNTRSGGPRQAQRIANRYPAGSDVLVYYNPSDPKVAVLEPGLPPGLWILAIIGLPMFAIGLGGILSLAGLLRFDEPDLMLIIGGPAALVGGALCWVGVQNLRRGSASKHWPTTEGRILSSVVRRSSGRQGTICEPDIVYQYAVDGTDYAHWAVDLRGLGTTCGSVAAEVVARYPVGATVTVYYDPDHPERAVLEPGLHWSNLVLLFVGLPFLAVGTGFLVVRVAGW